MEQSAMKKSFGLSGLRQTLLTTVQSPSEIEVAPNFLAVRDADGIGLAPNLLVALCPIEIGLDPVGLVPIPVGALLCRH